VFVKEAILRPTQHSFRTVVAFLLLNSFAIVGSAEVKFMICEARFRHREKIDFYSGVVMGVMVSDYHRQAPPPETPMYEADFKKFLVGSTDYGRITPGDIVNTFCFQYETEALTTDQLARDKKSSTESGARVIVTDYDPAGSPPSK
jgi:hypothetical protein